MMQNAYLGIDIGSISTKAVVIDEQQRIIYSHYLMTEGDPVGALYRLLDGLRRQIDKNEYSIRAVGTTGSARRIIGSITQAVIVKNEITAHAVGTLSMFPEARTVFEIGGQDSKIILLNRGVVTDYAMNTLCAAGTGAFLSAQAQRLKIPVEQFGDVAASSKEPVTIAARCTVFAESDLVHKLQLGYRREDVVAGLCNAVVSNYLNGVCKGKKIVRPVIFQGGVSKNTGVVKAFERALGYPILVGANGHLAGALGIAILAMRTGVQKPFNFDLLQKIVETKASVCDGCANHCERIMVYCDGVLLDAWGNRCTNGSVII